MLRHLQLSLISAMGDFHELKLEFRRVWSPVLSPYPVTASSRSTPNSPVREALSRVLDGATPIPSYDVSPGARFCHVGVVYESAFYIFGGYDGTRRLNDFLRYRFDQNEPVLVSTPSTLIEDLRKYVNSDLLSDIKFVVEGKPIYAHKIMCMRCPYFYNMLTGEYMESRASEITIPDIRYDTFLLLLEYLYTDEVEVGFENAMELFQAADMFGIERLKRVCEQEMLNAINIETSAQILFTADIHSAEVCLIEPFSLNLSFTTLIVELARALYELHLDALRRSDKNIGLRRNGQN